MNATEELWASAPPLLQNQYHLVRPQRPTKCSVKKEKEKKICHLVNKAQDIQGHRIVLNHNFICATDAEYKYFNIKIDSFKCILIDKHIRNC